MTQKVSPKRLANSLTTLLNTAFGRERFPVDVKQLARDYSHQRYPGDPITLIQGANLPEFDGALFKAPFNKKGWGIVYNDGIRSPGRINFTLAHEFGHYLLHRDDHPEGIECGQQDMVRWDGEYREIEQQANEFAATLLMPFDDFRIQIGPRIQPSLENISFCADRYRVSLVAATLRWLQYTESRSLLIVSRDGFILWARSSESALKSGAFIRTANRPPVAVPKASLTQQRPSDNGSIVHHEGGIWLPEPCRELAIVSEQFDFGLSLLHLGDSTLDIKLDDEPEVDTLNAMTRQSIED